MWLLRLTKILLVLLLGSSAAMTQPVNVTIRVTDEKNNPLAGSTLSMSTIADTTKKSQAVANAEGLFMLMLSKDSTYLVSATATGYSSQERTLIPARQQSYTIVMIPAARTLGGVTVRSSRPLMRQEDDKTVVDPENLIPTSTSGFEVLEKIPGLFVDQDGNFYISSTTPAAIYINGREMKMSRADIATMLKSLPPNSIVKVEILRTPSAKYDASGAGGIVNVVLKKGIRLGTTGSITAGWQQGKHGNQLLGFNLNNNNGKLTSYLNANAGRRDNYERINTTRLFAPDSSLSQDALTRYPAWVYYAGYGLNLEASPKWEVGYDGRISLNDFDNSTDNRSVINKISTNQLLLDAGNSISNRGTDFLLSQSFSGKYKIDSAGSEWTTDLSYTYARNNADQLYSSASNPAGFFSSGDGNNLSNRHLVTIQSDVARRFKWRLTAEAGLKSSWMNFRSDADYFISQDGSPREKDITRTNTFRYRENINAAYIQGSQSLSDVVIKAGLRMENTNMNGHQLIPTDTSFQIHRTDFFPYVYISKKVMTILGFELRAYLVYRKTITRPVYEQLNPFVRYVDQFLSETGNPALRPQFTQNYEANISVDETPLLAIGINDTKDIFTNVIYQADTNSTQAFRTYDNLGKNREFYIRGLGAIPPGKAYFFVVGGQYNHNNYNGLYEGKPLVFRKGTWTFFTYHTLKFARVWQATVNGFIRLKGQQQFYELTSFGALNASINRQFLKQKLIVTLSANDIFHTNQNNFTIRQGEVDANGFRVADTRRIGINVRYNFGIRKKEEAGMNMLKQEW